MHGSSRLAKQSLVALLMGVAPIAINSANAQTAGPSQPAGAAPGVTASEQNEEIVVVAQRRSESAQKVPITLQAFSTETLQRAAVTRTEDLTTIVGGLLVQPTGARPALFLRGVGNNSANTTPSVQTFVDGVYRPFGQSTDLLNITSVEVSKGPQGTLFGRNATGGVIQVITAPPSDTFAGRLQGGYGNYKTVDTSAYLTGGLGNGFAMDVALHYLNQGQGFGTNIADGADAFFTRRFTARSRLRWDISDSTDVTLGGDWNKVRGTAGTNVSPAFGYNYLFVAGAVQTRGGAFYPGKYDINANLNPYYESEESGTDLTFNTRFSGVEFRSISAYRQNDEQARIDFDGGPANATNVGIDRGPRRAFTQELQLLSNTPGPFQWVVGTFYYRSKWASEPFQLCVGVNLFTTGCRQSHSQDSTNSVAAYAQGTYAFTPDTRLTIGARETSEKREIEGFVVIGGAEVAGSRGTLSQDIREPTWRVALDHNFTPNVMAYASVSRGFNSGFFNQTSFAGFANETQNPRVLPEFLTAYEAGVKTDLLDRRLRVNLSGYFYKYDGLQQQIYDLGAVKTINAGAAEIRGIDFEILARPMPALTLSWTGALVDSQFTKYPLAPNYVPQPNGSIIAVGNLDAKGNHIVNAPEWSWTASASHDLQTSVGLFTTSANLNYRGTTFADPQNRFKLPTRYVLNATERWTMPDGHRFISLWAQNLLDEHYDYAINILTPVGLVGNPAPPRTYGISAGFDF